MSNELPKATEETSEQPSYVTKEELAQVVNSAITGHLKRLNVSKQVTDALELSLAPFRDQLGKTSPEATDKAPAANAQAQSAQHHPELGAMQKKMELMEKSFKDRELQILAKERISREREAFSKVSSELAALGVRAEGVDHLAKVLKADGKIKVDDDGAISFLEGDEEKELVSGLKSYLNPKTNPAVALYLPPKVAIKGGKPSFTESRGASLGSDSPNFKDIKDPAKRSVAMLEWMQSHNKK